MTDSMLCGAPGDCESYAVSCDYGTVNPSSFGLWGKKGGVWYRMDEYYYDSRSAGSQRTDEEHYAGLEQLCGKREIESVVVDPSAASFITALRQAGFPVTKADNEVLDGIRVTADLLKNRRLVICSICADCLREMELYCWESQGNRESPRKENDHAMDDLRYFAMSVARESKGFAATYVERRA